VGLPLVGAIISSSRRRLLHGGSQNVQREIDNRPAAGRATVGILAQPVLEEIFSGWQGVVCCGRSRS